MPLFLILLLLFSGLASAVANQPQEDVTDAIAVASILTMFGLGFISGAK